MASSVISARTRPVPGVLSSLDYTNRGYVPSVKRQIIDLALNGSGIRDTARVLGISTDTVLSELKKRSASSSR